LTSKIVITYRILFYIADTVIIKGGEMKKLILIACFVLAISNIAYADYSVNVTVNKVRINDDGMVYFGTSSQPSNTCDFYGTYYKFDSTTEGGAAMLSLVLSARLSGTAVVVWYNESTVPGTDASSGCYQSTLSKVYSVGFYPE
jgi:hypothetical protein